MSRIPSIVVSALLACGVGRAAEATGPATASPDNFLENYQIDVFTTQHGLPQNSVIRMAQTPDGFLWLTSWNGLAKFDGVRFTVFNVRNSPGLQSSRVIGVTSDNHGGLWLHTEDDDICHYSNGRFIPYTTEQGVPSAGIYSVGQDAAGRTWFGARDEKGIFRLEKGRLERIFPGEPFNGVPMDMLLDADKNLWTFAGDDFVRLDPPDLKSPQPLPKKNAYTLDNTGHIVTITREKIARLLSDGSWQTIAPSGALSNSITFFIHAQDGSFWGDSMDGHIWRLGTDGHLSIKKTSESFRCIIQAPDGSIWLGTDGGGLLRLKPKQIRTLTPQNGISGNVIKSVTATDNGDVWASSFEGLDRISSATMQVIDRRKGHPHYWVLQADRDEVLWAGSFGGGAGRWKDGKLENIKLGAKDLKNTCLALHVDSMGNVWAGGRFGFLQLIGAEATPAPLPKGDYDFQREPIRAIAEDKDRKLYLGFTGRGLMVRDGERWSQYRRHDGLPDDTISAIYPDQDGTIWLGTMDYGIGRMKNGSFFSFGQSRQWPAQAIFSIIEDDFGYLWIGSNGGLYRVQRKLLNAFADGQNVDLGVRRFDTSDGLATTEFAQGEQPTACKTKDGKLWFATVRGVACVDPKQITANTHPPKVYIEEIFADERPIDLKDGSATIRPGQGRIEIRFTALSFLAPEKVRFRVKLEPLDSDWMDGDTRRSVIYNHVRPGNYRFHVIACNNDGVWNETGATLAMTVQPFIWETKWFRISLGALLASIVGWYFRRKVIALELQRRSQREFSQKLIETQEQERKRIAGELHDGLGQKLQLIRNRAQLAIDKGEPPGSLSEISTITHAAITEVRSITAALRPSELDEVGLRGAVEWMIERVGKASSLRILAEIDPIDGLLTPVNEMHLYRIIQETLNNIIKHAHATHATIEIKKADGALTISIFDNGCGFDPANFPARRQPGGGLGLAGIRERVHIVGGMLVLDSKDGAGTRLIVTIPLA